MIRGRHDQRAVQFSCRLQVCEQPFERAVDLDDRAGLIRLRTVAALREPLTALHKIRVGVGDAVAVISGRTGDVPADRQIIDVKGRAGTGAARDIARQRAARKLRRKSVRIQIVRCAVRDHVTVELRPLQRLRIGVGLRGQPVRRVAPLQPEVRVRKLAAVHVVIIVEAQRTVALPRQLLREGHVYVRSLVARRGQCHGRTVLRIQSQKRLALAARSAAVVQRGVEIREDEALMRQTPERRGEFLIDPVAGKTF